MKGDLYLHGLIGERFVPWPPVVATGGTITEEEFDGRNYKVHTFTDTPDATFDDSGNELDSTTNEVDGHTVVDGSLIYVEDSDNAEQVGKCFRASGETSDWTWTFYGLTVTDAGTDEEVEYLSVAGGGAGGKSGAAATSGAGGGAGGLLFGAIGIYVSDLQVKVGRGGIAPVASGTRGANGTDSIFMDNTSFGGGGGGAAPSYNNGANGGSGGGSTLSSVGGSGEVGPPRQGYDGGHSSGANTIGGGGGGSGGIGQNASSTVAGVGGDGKDVWGDWYAGGGGGGTYNTAGYPAEGGEGGQGGGGKGGDKAGNGQSGVDGTGGGGGGNSTSSSAAYESGNGGSGIVKVRYPVEAA